MPERLESNTSYFSDEDEAAVREFAYGKYQEHDQFRGGPMDLYEDTDVGGSDMMRM